MPGGNKNPYDLNKPAVASMALKTFKSLFTPHLFMFFFFQLVVSRNKSLVNLNLLPRRRFCDPVKHQC